MDEPGLISAPPQNVIGEVVGRGLCIGCGVCVVACPRNHLSMVHDGRTWGVTGSCDKNCGTCLSVCPFWFENADEDELAAGLFTDGR